MVKQVYHQNLIGHEINLSLQYGYPESDRQIYCKRHHKISEPTAQECENCPYYAGWMGGYGHECKWEDYIPSGQSDTKIIRHQDAKKEMLRVSELIDKGVLKKG